MDNKSRHEHFGKKAHFVFYALIQNGDRVLFSVCYQIRLCLESQRNRIVYFIEVHASSGLCFFTSHLENKLTCLLPMRLTLKMK